MSKNKNLVTELSTEELLKQKKTLTGAALGLGITMIAACVILFYLIIRSKNYMLIMIIPACMISLIPSFMRLGQINAELKSRKKQG